MRKFLRFIIIVLIIMPVFGVFFLADTVDARDTDSWRNIRQGIAGYTAVQGQESGVLIQAGGQNWRQLRNGLVAVLGKWGIAMTVMALGGFFLLRGQVKLTPVRSGVSIPRWSLFERILHWYSAFIFIILMISGLSLLYGRSVLIPLIGHPAFAAYAEIAKVVHNYTGPLFIVGLLLIFFTWVKDNLPNRLDLKWVMAFGGLIGDKHPSAQRMNAGEKGWFWLLVFAGVAVSVSGLILDFTNFGQQRSFIQINHIVHACSAILLSIGALGHIYIGTIGTEGAFEGMIKGKVDKNWAKQHHDLWYKEVTDTNRTEPRP
jgi:formate dehydrogenase subunit gamma